MAHHAGLDVSLETTSICIVAEDGRTIAERKVPIVRMDARHANAALSMMPSKTDRTDARGLARIVRTGWSKQVHVKSSESHRIRARLAARCPVRRTALSGPRFADDRNAGRRGGERPCLRL